MKREAFMLRVKRDKLAEYEQRHKAVWADMLDALRKAGWHNYSIFLNTQEGILFGYVEVDDSLAAAIDRMALEEVNKRWQDYMAPFFEETAGAHADKAFVVLKEVFHLQ